MRFTVALFWIKLSVWDLGQALLIRLRGVAIEHQQHEEREERERERHRRGIVDQMRNRTQGFQGR